MKKNMKKNRKHERLCVDPLPSWARSSPAFKNNGKDSFLQCVGVPCTEGTIFNRFGMYIDKKAKRCWVESPHGAYEYPNGYKQYLYEIEIDIHKPLPERDLNALILLQKSKLLNTGMVKMMEIDKMWKHMHKQRVYGLRVTKRFYAFKKKYNL